VLVVGRDLRAPKKDGRDTKYCTVQSRFNKISLLKLSQPYNHRVQRRATTSLLPWLGLRSGQRRNHRSRPQLAKLDSRCPALVCNMEQCRLLQGRRITKRSELQPRLRCAPDDSTLSRLVALRVQLGITPRRPGRGIATSTQHLATWATIALVQPALGHSGGGTGAIPGWRRA
jgi:hypothetical protein